MQPDTAEVTNSLLLGIAASLRNETYSSTDSDLFHAPTSVLWINGLWIASLISSLASAFFALLARQWLQEYKLWMSRHLDDDHIRARLRHFRHMGIESWRMSPILRGLPLLIHLALLLFGGGLILYIARFDRRIMVVPAVLVVTIVIFYVITLMLPFFYAQCPYQTLPVKPLQKLFLRMRYGLLQIMILLPKPYAPIEAKRRIEEKIHVDSETSVINESGHVLDAQILASLLSSPEDELELDKIIIKMIGSIFPESETRVGNILLELKIGELVAKRYKELLTIHEKAPFTTVNLAEDGVANEAYNCLRALHFLSVHNAMPSGWASGRIGTSLLWLKAHAKDRNMKAVVLGLIHSIRYAATKSFDVTVIH